MVSRGKDGLGFMCLGWDLCLWKMLEMLVAKLNTIRNQTKPMWVTQSPNLTGGSKRVPPWLHPSAYKGCNKVTIKIRKERRPERGKRHTVWRLRAQVLPMKSWVKPQIQDQQVTLSSPKPSLTSPKSSLIQAEEFPCHGQQVQIINYWVFLCLIWHIL